MPSATPVRTPAVAQGNKRVEHTAFAGLPISLEYRKGDTRSGKSSDGKAWFRKMQADYGYVRGSKGTDGDHVDVYIGPSADSQMVFVVDQMKYPEFKTFDEQKFMLGYKDLDTAKTAYLAHYPDARILGKIKGMTLGQFTAKVTDRKNHGKKLAEDIMIQRAALLFAELKLAGVEVEPEQLAKISGDRVHRISERVDDAGLALLAAPSAAYLTGSALKRLPNAKAKAVGEGLQHGVESLRGATHHGTELTGLALVSPTVSKTVAKAVNKLMPKEKLAKLASEHFSDFEYMTEIEKQALIGALGRMAGGAVKAVRGATGTGRMLGAMTAAERAAVSPATASIGQKFRAGAQSAARGREVSPSAIQRLDRMRAPKAPAPAAAPQRKLLSARNMLIGGGVAAGGAGLYAGKKVLDTGAALATQQHEPWQTASVYGQNRVF
jgi:hypothetical protein